MLGVLQRDDIGDDDSGAYVDLRATVKRRVCFSSHRHDIFIFAFNHYISHFLPLGLKVSNETGLFVGEACRVLPPMTRDMMLFGN